MNLTETEKRMYGTMFVLFIVSMAFGTGVVSVDKIMNLVSGNGYVIQPTPGQSGTIGLAQPGETIRVDLSVNPTKSYVADANPLDDGRVLLLRKQVTVKRIGESGSRYDSTTELLTTSTSSPITTHVDYTVPTTEQIGAFIITERIYKIPGVYNTQTGRVVLDQLNTEDLGYQQAAFYVKQVCPECIDEATLRQILQDLLDQLLCNICYGNSQCSGVITNPYCIPK